MGIEKINPTLHLHAAFVNAVELSLPLCTNAAQSNFVGQCTSAKVKKASVQGVSN